MLNIKVWFFWDSTKTIHIKSLASWEAPPSGFVKVKMLMLKWLWGRIGDYHKR